MYKLVLSIDFNMNYKYLNKTGSKLHFKTLYHHIYKINAL